MARVSDAHGSQGGSNYYQVSLLLRFFRVHSRPSFSTDFNKAVSFEALSEQHASAIFRLSVQEHNMSGKWFAEFSAFSGFD